MGLAALGKKSVKQIGSDASQLYYLLLKENLIERNGFTEKAAKEHAEISKLRFDKERSTLEDLPLYIRQPLFDILTGYADGAVQRVNHRWQDIEVNPAFLHAINYKPDAKQT